MDDGGATEHVATVQDSAFGVSEAQGPTARLPEGGLHDQPERLLTSAAAPMIQILGLFLTVGAFLAWRGGGDVELPTVVLVLALVVLLVGLVFAWRGDAILGFVVGAHWLLVSAVFLLVCAVVVPAVVLLPSVRLTLSTAPVAIVGVVSLVGPMLEGAQHGRASRSARRAEGAQRSGDRLFNTVVSYLAWQIPLAAVVLVGALWIAGVSA